MPHAKILLRRRNPQTADDHPPPASPWSKETRRSGFFAGSRLASPRSQGRASRLRPGPPTRLVEPRYRDGHLVTGQASQPRFRSPDCRVRRRTARFTVLDASLAAPALAQDRRQVQEDRTIAQIATLHEVVDADQDHRTLGVDETPLVVGEERAARVAPAERKLADTVGKSSVNCGDILIDD